MGPADGPLRSTVEEEPFQGRHAKDYRNTFLLNKIGKTVMTWPVPESTGPHMTGRGNKTPTFLNYLYTLPKYDARRTNATLQAAYMTTRTDTAAWRSPAYMKTVGKRTFP